MPYKNHEKKRDYQREYMRQRRVAVRPSASPEVEAVRPHQEALVSAEDFAKEWLLSSRRIPLFFCLMQERERR
jgi:hypothetical protein